MSYTYDRQEITAALRSSFVGDSQTLKQTADYLAAAALSPGFALRLMEIVDDPLPPLEIKQAALVQLKNHFKLRWVCGANQVAAAEKEMVRSALVLALCRCHSDYKLLKLYREVLTQVVNHDYKTWLPVAHILELLSQQASPVPLLHALLAIASSFEFSISEEERVFFFEFLKSTLPVLFDLISRQPLPELLYLCMKFLWKTVHYEISPQVKTLTCQWMPLLQAVISATNPTHDAHPEDTQPRASEEFYYFHSKKWATRVLLRFLQKHAKRISYENKDNKPFSDQWYANYGEGLTAALLAQFAVPTNKKIRYFQLKCLQSLIQERPNSLAQYAENFQYDYLLRFLQLQPEDEELANRDPLDFLSKEDEPSLNYTNLKRVATDVWVGFAELGSKAEKKGHPYEAGRFFFQNMNWLQGRLEGGNPLEKEMAMYLICQLRSPITRCKQVKKMLPTLITRYVIPEFQNPIMFLRARAVDIFMEYGSMNLEIQVVKLAVEGIYRCLTQDSCALVRIKAASAFNCILRHKTAKDLVRPLLKDILTVYLQLLEHYDLENLVTSLQSIVDDFAVEIAPFAFELVKHLTRLYLKLFSKDVEKANNEDYDGQAELAAAGCLKTITRIIQSPIPVEAITQLEPDIIALLEFIFGEEGVDYIEDVLVLLNSYLFKAPQLTAGLWFYWQVIIYNLVGIPKQVWPTLENLPLTQNQRKVLANIKGGNNEEYMETSMPVLRNFVQKVASCPLEGRQPLKQSLLELLFYLNTSIYKKTKDHFSGEIEATCCTALLIYLLENFSSDLPEQIYSHIWDIAKLNFTYKSRMMKLLTSQLLALLVWATPTVALTLAHRDQLLQQLLKELTGYQPKYEMEHERARVVLGLNKLLSLPEKPAELLVHLPQIFKTVVKLVRKNAEDRILQDPNHEASSSQEVQQEEEDLDNYNFESDDQDFWEEQYDDNYTSPLDSIDQVAQFKQTVEALAAQQPQVYSQLVSCVPQEELQSLQHKIRKAIDHVSELAQSQ